MAETSAAPVPVVDDQHPAAVEVDPRSDDDSQYGEELSSYTSSLTSSVLNYRQENGRRYHGYHDGHYLMPNDEEESERLDMLHEMFVATMERKLFLAPIGSHPQNVIDLGTGTGIWAIDFADQFSSAEVTGNDLSPTQPTLVPPNLRFIIEDVEDEWIYPDNTFDFVHGRFLAIAIKDMPKLIKQAYRCAKPGGWVEFQDLDLQIYSNDESVKGTSIEQYYREIREAFEEAGYPTRPGPKLKGWFEEAGFTDIHVRKYYIPMGTWPKDKYHKNVGAWNLAQADTGFESSAMAVLTRFKSWSPTEVQILVAKTKNDARNRAIHGLFDFYVVYGRKPE